MKQDVEIIFKSPRLLAMRKHYVSNEKTWITEEQVVPIQMRPKFKKSYQGFFATKTNIQYCGAWSICTALNYLPNIIILSRRMGFGAFAFLLSKQRNRLVCWKWGFTTCEWVVHRCWKADVLAPNTFIPLTITYNMKFVTKVIWICDS